MSSAILFNLDQTKILSSGNGAVCFISRICFKKGAVYDEPLPQVALVQIKATAEDSKFYCDSSWKICT